MIISFPTLVLPAVLALAATLMTTLATLHQSDDSYAVRRIDSTRAALLAGDAEPWSTAQQINWGTAPWPTAFRALATDEALWLRFDAVDDSPWHTLTNRDDHLWNEEVVEIFIDPDGDHRNYAEIEVSPANVVCDLLVAQGSPDLRADIDWDFAGIETAVHAFEIEGAEVGWTAIVRLPWSGFDAVPGTDVALPPAAGDRWEFNVFRIKRPHGPAEPNRGLVLDAWSPVPAGSFHVPEVFRIMEFE
jgi:hypothetical protein